MEKDVWYKMKKSLNTAEPTSKEVGRKALDTSKKILIIIGVTTLLFMVIWTAIFCLVGSVPDVLIERYFTCVLGEGGCLMIIKVIKTVVEKKYGINSEDSSDELSTDTVDYEDSSEV